MTLAAICRSSLVMAFLIAIGCGVSGQPLDPRCMQSGGDALCRDPIPLPSTPTAPVDSEMWTYNVCDLDGPFPWRQQAWCTALGGCGKPIFDTTLVAVSAEFERIVNKACEVSVIDSGWGQSLPSNILCWSGPPLSQGRVLIRDFRILNFSGFSPTPTGCNAGWKDTVYAGRWRNAGCPPGFGQRIAANGELECWRFIPKTCTVGNPIDLLDGCKLQRELDYRSRAPGGIQVERYYNSTGFIRFDARADKASDYWRTTWDRHIVVPSVTGSVLAYAQRADGSLLIFLPNGREKSNLAGGGSARLERLVDGAGITTGWRLTTADTDIELYDASGRLTSITMRAGWTYALGYDANGRLANVTDASGTS